METIKKVGLIKKENPDVNLGIIMGCKNSDFVEKYAITKCKKV